MFQKGKSGNPGGRPKISAEVKGLFQRACPKAAQTIIELMSHRSPRVRLAAATFVIERIYGKASQDIELSGKDGSPITPVINLIVNGQQARPQSAS